MKQARRVLAISLFCFMLLSNLEAQQQEKVASKSGDLTVVILIKTGEKLERNLHPATRIRVDLSNYTIDMPLSRIREIEIDGQKQQSDSARLKVTTTDGKLVKAIGYAYGSAKEKTFFDRPRVEGERPDEDLNIYVGCDASTIKSITVNGYVEPQKYLAQKIGRPAKVRFGDGNVVEFPKITFVGHKSSGYGTAPITAPRMIMEIVYDVFPTESLKLENSDRGLIDINLMEIQKILVGERGKVTLILRNGSRVDLLNYALLDKKEYEEFNILKDVYAYSDLGESILSFWASPKKHQVNEISFISP